MMRDLWIEAANHFFDKPYQIYVLGDSSGYSDSRLARVTDRQGQWWCLRQWSHTTAETLHFIHQVLTHSRAQGFTGVPRLACTQTGETLLSLDNSWFEAQEWIAGSPAYRREAQDTNQRTPNTAWHFTPEERGSITRALAAFHASTETLQPGRQQQPFQAHVASVLRQAQRQQQRVLETHNGTKSPENKALIRQWLHLLPVLTTYPHAKITENACLRENTGTICHGDLWPAHVYFHNATFSGFVDFGALTFASPAIDLAQLILHFGGWQTREEVLATYTNYRPLSTQDEVVLPMVAACDLISEGYWALNQLQNHELSKQEAVAHWHNLQGLLPSLVALAEEVA